MPKGKNKKPVNKDRFIGKMFLRYVVFVRSDIPSQLILLYF